MDAQLQLFTLLGALEMHPAGVELQLFVLLAEFSIHVVTRALPSEAVMGLMR